MLTLRFVNGGKHLLLADNGKSQICLFDLKAKRIFHTITNVKSFEDLWQDSVNTETFYVLNREGVYRYIMPKEGKPSVYEISRITNIKNYGEYAATYTKAINNARTCLQERRYGEALKWNDIARRVPCFENSEEVRRLNEEIGAFCRIAGIRSAIRILPHNPKNLAWRAENKQFIDNGTTIFSAYRSEDNNGKKRLTFVLWDARTDKIHHLIPSKPNALHCVSADGSTAVILEKRENKFVFTIANLIEKTEQRFAFGSPDEPALLSCNRDGTRAAFLTKEKSHLVIADLQEKKLLVAAQAPSEVNRLVLSPESKYVVLRTMTELQLWDAKTLKRIDAISDSHYLFPAKILEMDDVNEYFRDEGGIGYSYKDGHLAKIDKKATSIVGSRIHCNMPSTTFAFDIPGRNIQIGSVCGSNALVAYDIEQEQLISCVETDIKWDRASVINKTGTIVLEPDNTMWYIDYIYSDPSEDNLSRFVENSPLLDKLRNDVERSKIRALEAEKKKRISQTGMKKAFELFEEGYTVAEYWEENKDKWGEEHAAALRWLCVVCKNNGEPESAEIPEEAKSYLSDF